MSSKWAPICRLREPLPTGVWTCCWMGSRVKVCVGFVDSLSPHELAECWESAENLLTCRRGSFKHPLSRGFIFFCQALDSLPDPLTLPPPVSPDIRLFTPLWCRQQFPCAGQVEAVSCTVRTAILQCCCIEKCKCRALFAFCLFWQLTRATKASFKTLRSEGMH